MRDLACNPGMCPDWESNQQTFGSQASAQSTEPHQPGLMAYIFQEFNPIFNLLMGGNLSFELRVNQTWIYYIPIIKVDAVQKCKY